jgi:condensin complex subunit 1
VLEERALDVSSYTRSKVLQTWIELVAAEAVPVAMLPSIVILASQRLLDKASQVRKYAMQLLTALLQHNPFSSKLSLTVFKAELERVGLEFKEDVASLQSRLHEAASKRKQDAELARRGFWGSTSGGKKTAAAAEGSGAKSAKAKSRGKKGGKRKARRDSEDSESEAEELEVSEDEEVEAIAEVDEEAAEGEEKAPDAPATDEGAGAVETPTEQEGPAEATATAAPVISESEDLELKAKRKQLDFFFDAICFVTGFHNSQGALLMLLGSKTNTDVLEAIQFFTTAAEFQLETAAEGVRKMLILVWSREAPIVEALIAAYQKLYVGELDAMESGANKQRQAMITAGRLVSLTLEATLADLTSLEELLTRLIAKKLVPPSVFAMLWEILLGRVAGTSPSEWNGALVVLTMAANALPEVIVSHLPALLQVGFGPRAKEHTSFTRNVCAALQKVVAARQKETREATSRIAEKMLGKAEVDDICEKLLALLQTPAVSFDANGRAVHDEAWYPAAEQAVGALFCLHAQPETVCGELLKSLARGVTGLVEDAGSASAKASTLARFFFVLGHVSIKLLLRLERVEDSLKRARAASAKAPQQDAAAAGEKSGGEGKAGKAASKIEDELAVGASQDLEIEQMREAAERSLLAQNLLGSLAPLVVKVCSNPKRFRDRVLQASAVLALCKLMCLSEDFCNEHLAVLVSIPRASDDPHVRANIVIALGDMCLRFPNLMDTRTHFLFERLGDKSPMVRKHTMLVLTHLILNDMLKIRGPVSDIAKCLQDEDQVIAGLAHAFFTELSQKSKDPIYNILPDIISRLSSDPGVSSEAFRYVLKFLLEFIDKERQVEGLIEKLCHRIAGSASDKECRDFSYCLAQLNLTEKSFRKLADLFRLYKDSLVDEAVHANFLAMSAKAKKLPKAELKTVIDEFEAKLEECHKRQRDDNASVQRAKAVKKVAAGPGDENVPPLEQTQTSTEFDVEAKVAEAFQRAAAARQEAELQKKATRGRKPADEPVADDGKSVAKGKKGKRAAPAKKPAKPRKRKVESSSEDEDDQEIDELSVSEPDD